MYQWLSLQATGLITYTGNTKALSLISIDCTTEPKLPEKLVEFSLHLIKLRLPLWSSGHSS
jgi:hypothetical protein